MNLLLLLLYDRTKTTYRISKLTLTLKKQFFFGVSVTLIVYDVFITSEKLEDCDKRGTFPIVQPQLNPKASPLDSDVTSVPEVPDNRPASSATITLHCVYSVRFSKHFLTRSHLTHTLRD